QRDHVAPLTGVRAIMVPGAICYFSNNLRSFRPDEAGLAAAGITLADITASTVAPDFARNARIHRCYTFAKE
ncbi:MAG: methylase, partial [Eggerthellaceae bacterium]|nr:methylase [Eggerthellaceae bacterium]